MKNNEIGGGFDTCGREETCLCDIGGKPKGRLRRGGKDDDDDDNNNNNKYLLTNIVLYYNTHNTLI